MISSLKSILFWAMLALAGTAFAQAQAPAAKDEGRSSSSSAPAKPSASADKADKADKSAKAADKGDKAKAGALIDINTATEKELAALPKIGDARAKAIVEGRPYRAKNELVDKKIVSQDVYDSIKERIVARQGAAGDKKADAKKADDKKADAKKADDKKAADKSSEKK